MTTLQAKPANSRAAWRMARAALLGGVVGYLSVEFGAEAIMADLLGPLTPEGGIALVVALVYVLIGAVLLFGTLWPRAGAQMLEVMDADELREEKRLYLSSAVAMVLFGLALAVLAAGTNTALGPPGTGMVFVLLLALGTASSLVTLRASDEMMRALMREAGEICYYLLFAVIGLWAAAAYLGLVAAPGMLTLVTLFWGLGLLGTFIAAGLRGQLVRKP